MHCHCGTNNRAPRWTFMEPCKLEVRPGAREESASPAWLAAPAMYARDTKCIHGGLTLHVDRHYIGSVTATTHHGKGIITLESTPPPPPRDKLAILLIPTEVFRVRQVRFCNITVPNSSLVMHSQKSLSKRGFRWWCLFWFPLMRLNMIHLKAATSASQEGSHCKQNSQNARV